MRGLFASGLILGMFGYMFDGSAEQKPVDEPVKVSKPMMYASVSVQADDEAEGIPKWDGPKDDSFVFKPDWYDDEPKWAEDFKEEVKEIVADTIKSELKEFREEMFGSAGAPPKPIKIDSSKKVPGVNGRWVTKEVTTGTKRVQTFKNVTSYRMENRQVCVNGRCRIQQVRVPFVQRVQAFEDVPVTETQREWVPFTEEEMKAIESGVDVASVEVAAGDYVAAGAAIIFEDMPSEESGMFYSNGMAYDDMNSGYQATYGDGVGFSRKGILGRFANFYKAVGARLSSRANFHAKMRATRRAWRASSL